MKVEKFLLVLSGAVIIVSVCFLIVSCRAENPKVSQSVVDNELAREMEIPEIDPIDLELEDILKNAGFDMKTAERQEIILSSYRNPIYKDSVLAFFHELAGSKELSEVVLRYSNEYNINPASTFSLCFEESRYNPRAINYNRNDTIDRGLFQLNSASFPKLTVDEFYDPTINTRNGLAHLRWCLDSAGTDVAALAMYNAGHARVRSTGTPKSTLDYISRILKRQRKIEDLFFVEYIRIVAANKGNEGNALWRFSLLTPLGR